MPVGDPINLVQLIDITLRHNGTNIDKTWRIATREYTLETNPPTPYTAGVARSLNITQQLFDNYQLAGPTEISGDIQASTHLGLFEDLPNYRTDSGSLLVRNINVDLGIASLETIFTGYIREWTLTESVATFRPGDPLSYLRTPICDTLFFGGFAGEDTSYTNGLPIPVSHGDVFNVNPTQIAFDKYFIGFNKVVKRVRIDGGEFDSPGWVYTAPYIELSQARAVQATNGIRVDFGEPLTRSAGYVAGLLAPNEVGINIASMEAFRVNSTSPVGVWFADTSSTVYDAIHTLCRGAVHTFMTNGDGELEFIRVVPTAQAPVVHEADALAPGSISIHSANRPTTEVRMSHHRNYAGAETISAPTTAADFLRSTLKNGQRLSWYRQASVEDNWDKPTVLEIDSFHATDWGAAIGAQTTQELTGTYSPPISFTLNETDGPVRLGDAATVRRNRFGMDNGKRVTIISQAHEPISLRKIFTGRELRNTLDQYTFDAFSFDGNTRLRGNTTGGATTEQLAVFMTLRFSRGLTQDSNIDLFRYHAAGLESDRVVLRYEGNTRLRLHARDSQYDMRTDMPIELGETMADGGWHSLYLYVDIASSPERWGVYLDGYNLTDFVAPRFRPQDPNPIAFGTSFEMGENFEGCIGNLWIAREIPTDADGEYAGPVGLFLDDNRRPRLIPTLVGANNVAAQRHHFGGITQFLTDRSQQTNNLSVDGTAATCSTSPATYGDNGDTGPVAPPIDPPMLIASMTSPQDGNVLQGPQVTANWVDPGSGATGYRLLVGSFAGSSAYYSSPLRPADRRVETVTNLPVDGSAVFFTLMYFVVIDGVTRTFTSVVETQAFNEIGNVSPPGFINPLEGAIIPGDTFNVTWASNGTDVGLYRLFAIAPGNVELYDSGNLTPATTSNMATGLPVDGSFYDFVLEYTANGGAAQTPIVVDVQARDQAVVVQPALLSPTPGEQMTSSTGIFSWTPNDVDVLEWRITTGGNSSSLDDIFDSGLLAPDVLSLTYTDLPVDGRAIQIDFRYRTVGGWQSVRSSVRGFTSEEANLPTIVYPPRQLPGADVTFTLDQRDIAVTTWRLLLGSGRSTANPQYPSAFSNYYQSNVFTPFNGFTQLNVTGLPTDGRPIFGSIDYFVGAEFFVLPFDFVAFNADQPVIDLPEITAPAPGSTLPNAQIDVFWAANGTANVEMWQLLVGTESGVVNIHGGAELAANVLTESVSGFPDTGGPVVMTLRWRIAGVWSEREFGYTAPNTTPPPEDVHFQVLPRAELLTETPNLVAPDLRKPDFRALNAARWVTNNLPLAWSGDASRPLLTQFPTTTVQLDFTSPTFQQQAQQYNVFNTAFAHTGTTLTQALPQKFNGLFLTSPGDTELVVDPSTIRTSFSANPNGPGFVIDGIIHGDTYFDGFSNQPAYYQTTWGTYQKFDPLRRPMINNAPKCGVWLGNQLLLYVETAAELVEGTFTIDRTNFNVIVFTNPAASGSVLRYTPPVHSAAWNRGDGTALIAGLQGITCQHWGGQLQVATVGAGDNDPGFQRLYLDCNFQDNVAVGLQYAATTYGRGLRINRNGHNGLQGFAGQHVMFEDCEMNENNKSFSNQGDHSAGHKSGDGDARPHRNIHFLRCTASRNHGPGFWIDFAEANILFNQCIADDNDRAGFYLEVVGRCAIVEPTARNNNIYQQSGLNGWLGAAITAHNASDILILGGLIDAQYGGCISFANQSDGARVGGLTGFKYGDVMSWDGRVISGPTGPALMARTVRCEVIGTTMIQRMVNFAMPNSFGDGTLPRGWTGNQQDTNSGLAATAKNIFVSTIADLNNLTNNPPTPAEVAAMIDRQLIDGCWVNVGATGQKFHCINAGATWPASNTEEWNVFTENNLPLRFVTYRVRPQNLWTNGSPFPHGMTEAEFRATHMEGGTLLFDAPPAN